MIFLENEHLTASFANKGAELQTLKSKKHNIDYLWSGNPNYWGKFSPILFPIVGSLKDNTYYFEHKEYKLPRHGFARDYDFEPLQRNNTEVVFTLTHNDETLKVYPFPFVLRLRYILSESGLSCTYEVTNPADDLLLFSIGAHPAFKVPIQDDVLYTDYFLKFNKDQVLTYHKISGDLIANEVIEIELKEGKLPLQHQLFYEDALVFKSLKSDCISIACDKNPYGLHFKFKDFPFFGIWAAKNANFVCLEPWCGIADGIDHQQNLEEKEGIVSLAPGKTWSRSWEIECY